MKILFVNTLYAPIQVGGAEVSVQTMAEALVKSGHRVYVLTLGYDASVRELNGVEVITIRTRNLYHIEKAAGQPSYKKLIWHLLDSANPYYGAEIGRVLDRVQPDVVNTNNIQGFSPYIWKIIKARNIRLVHTMRDYYLLCHTTAMYAGCKDCTQLCGPCKLTYTIKKRFFHLPDAYIGISQFILEQHSRFSLGNDKPVRVIANGLRTPERGVTVKSPSSNLVFGFIGKVNEQKGVDFLFDELAALGELRQSFKLVLAGKVLPEFESELRDKYDGKFEFSFLGKTDSETFYESVDLVIVPSGWNEPFGRVPIEAAATGTPVCLANKGGLKELYDERCMWQFEMKKNSLKDLMKSIIQTPGIISEKSSACAARGNTYSPETVNERLIEFLDTLHG
jgi:glycosyltransferase involved in cell wall biosynthesis